jgi:hypothetical protein
VCTNACERNQSFAFYIFKLNPPRALSQTKSNPTAPHHKKKFCTRVSFARIYFFLPATVLTLPLRVRALVLVRWPRQGSPGVAARGAFDRQNGLTGGTVSLYK